MQRHSFSTKKNTKCTHYDQNSTRHHWPLLSLLISHLPLTIKSKNKLFKPIQLLSLCIKWYIIKLHYKTARFPPFSLLPFPKSCHFVPQTIIKLRRRTRRGSMTPSFVHTHTQTHLHTNTHLENIHKERQNDVTANVLPNTVFAPIPSSTQLNCWVVRKRTVTWDFVISYL